MQKELVGTCKLYFHITFLSFFTDANARLRPGIQSKIEALRALYAGKKIIVGRDKLDVVKGILQKVGFVRLAFSTVVHRVSLTASCI
jgi:hypothetical protein